MTEENPLVTQGLQELAQDARQFAVQSHGAGTLKAYRSAWNAYSAWCATYQRAELNADPVQIALYATHLAKRLTVASIRVHMAAIVMAHRTAGKQLDLKHPAIAPVLEGITRSKGRRPTRQATPVVPDALKRMVIAQPVTLLGLRNRALLLIGFGAAMRRSELAELEVGDAIDVPGKGVMLTIRRSKTDQHGEGQNVAIPLADDPVLCASSALKVWLRFYRPMTPSRPLFCAFRKQPGGVNQPSHEFMHDRTVARIIKEAAELANLPDPHAYSGHSLRAGLLTSAGEEGVELADAMRQSRHKSAAVALGYIRPASLWKNNASGKVLNKNRA